tara:strand:- start:133 stop:336 length:204 start_codon:yes stop_codon:yes gene_type:complete
MSNNKILKDILKEKSLKDKYWKEINVDNENIKTASIHKNNNIRVLATLLNDDSKPMKIKNIKSIYNI